MGNIGNITGIGSLTQSGQGGATDSFIKLTVDLTGITPTTQTYKGKTYNSFAFTVNELTINSISPLGDVETIAINDALIYNLLPMSNSNDDKGIHIEYSNNTFTGYVLSTESTLTIVNFIFSYYLELTKTSILWENYTDMILGGASKNYFVSCKSTSPGYWFTNIDVNFMMTTDNVSNINNINSLAAYLFSKVEYKAIPATSTAEDSNTNIVEYVRVGTDSDLSKILIAKYRKQDGTLANFRLTTVDSVAEL